MKARIVTPAGPAGVACPTTAVSPRPINRVRESNFGAFVRRYVQPVPSSHVAGPSAAQTSPKYERSALSQAHPVTAGLLGFIEPVIRPSDPLFVGLIQAGGTDEGGPDAH